MVKERDFGAEFDKIIGSKSASGRQPKNKFSGENRKSYKKGLESSKSISGHPKISFENYGDMNLIKYGPEFDTGGGHRNYENKIELAGIAKGLLNGSLELAHGANILGAIKIYEFIGKVDGLSKSNVLKSFKKYVEKYGSRDNVMYLVEPVKIFLNSPSTKKKNLEKKVGGTMAIIGVVGGLVFLAPALTANVVGNLTNSTSGWVGGILFILGLTGALFYFRNK